MSVYARTNDPVTSWEAAETWKPIPGWEDLYEVSDHGKVRSLDRITSHGRRVKGKNLRLHRNPFGHVEVSLYRAGRRKLARVHRLMLEAFVGPCPEGMKARHLDDVPYNNILSNLKWGTSSENQYDSVRNGTHSNAAKTHCPRDHEYTKENTYIGRNGGRFCRQCARIAKARFIAKNPESHRKSQKKWQQKNQEKLREYRREYRRRKQMEKTTLQPAPKEGTSHG